MVQYEGMILEITADQAAFRDEVVRFAAERVLPAAAAIDAEGRYPRQLVAELAERGLMGLTIPPEWGGGGRDYIGYALAIEALAHASAVIAVIAGVNTSLVAEPIAAFGTDAQKQAWLRRLATGQAIGAFALSEEHAGSDAANQQTTARLDDRGYVINWPQGMGRQCRSGGRRDRLRGDAAGEPRCGRRRASRGTRP